MSKTCIEVVRAMTPEEKSRCYRVRYDVFTSETGYIRKTDPRGEETDEFDALPTTFHFLALYNGTPAGTARLLLPNPEVAKRKGTVFGLPMEELFDISEYREKRLRIGEISRSCVKKRFKSTKTIFHLWRELIEFALERNITDLVTNVNPETDKLDDALVLYRYLKEKGLFTGDVSVTPKKGTTGKKSGFRFPLIKGGAGVADITLPQTLKLFTKVGILFTGKPVYSEKIDMCAMPMNWRLKDIEKTAFRRFFRKDFEARNNVA